MMIENTRLNTKIMNDEKFLCFVFGLYRLNSKVKIVPVEMANTIDKRLKFVSIWYCNNTFAFADICGNKVIYINNTSDLASLVNMSSLK